MRSETFSYLSDKVVSEFEGCGWSDDLSSTYSAKYLDEIASAFEEMSSVEERVQQLVEEVHGKIKYY